MSGECRLCGGRMKADRAARVLVLGGYGLVGLPIVRRLIDAGADVVGLGRDPEFGRAREPRCAWIGADISSMTSPGQWASCLSGIDVVVNVSGALQTGLRDNLHAVQEKAVVALIEACETADVTRFVQISAPGASASAETEFLRTKGVADARLRSSSIGWVILKPGLVVSSDAYGGTALLRMLASFPIVLPVVHADACVATVDATEVAEAVALAVSGVIPAGSDIEVAEQHPGTLRDVVMAFRSWLGLSRPVAIIDLPPVIGHAAGKVADVAGWLGWRSPLRSTALKVIAGGVGADSGEYSRITGREPTGLAETLTRYPSTVQERWFALLYLAMPAAVLTLSLFWIVSGLVGLVRLEESAAHMAAAGIGSAEAKAVVVAGSVIDLAVGAGALVRKMARPACLAMVAVTAAYLLGGTFVKPELWMDPLGPYVKTVPAAMLAMMTAVLVRTR